MAEWINVKNVLPLPTQNTICLVEYWDFSRDDGSLFKNYNIEFGHYYPNYGWDVKPGKKVIAWYEIPSLPEREILTNGNT